MHKNLLALIRSAVGLICPPLDSGAGGGPNCTWKRVLELNPHTDLSIWSRCYRYSTLQPFSLFTLYQSLNHLYQSLYPTVYTNLSILYTNLSIIFTNLSILYTNLSILYTNLSIIYTNLSIIYTNLSIIYTNLSIFYTNLSTFYQSLHYNMYQSLYPLTTSILCI